MSASRPARGLLILGGGEQQVAALKAARRLGLTAICADPNPNALGREIAHHFHAVDLGDVPALKQIAVRHEIAGILTLAADYPLEAAAIIGRELGLCGPTIDAVKITRDKSRLRECMSQHSVRAPHWQDFTSPADAESSDLLRSMTCIIKPTDSSGGRGVHYLTPSSTIEEIRRAIEVAFLHSKKARIVVEEYVEGKEYSVESLTFGGVTHTVAITGKFTSGPPYFVETGHVVPAQISNAEAQEISDYVANLVRLIGLDSCATHTELKLTPDGPMLIELAARLGGGYINTDLVPLATGVDMVCAVIDIALGLKPDLQPAAKKAAAMKFLIPSPGVLDSVTGLDSARSLAGMHRAVCDYQSGDRVGVVRDATGRKCYIIGSAENAQAAIALIDQAAAKIEFRYRDD